MVTLYYCITSLPVYPHTVHGHCTTVVVDTSNSVYCIATLMECTIQCTAPIPLGVAKGFCVEVRQSFEFCSTPDKEYSVYCIATLMECTVQCTAPIPPGVAKGFCVEVRQSFEFCSTPDKEYTFYHNHHFSLIITIKAVFIVYPNVQCLSTTL
jgi:hypothetical protein